MTTAQIELSPGTAAWVAEHPAEAAELLAIRAAEARVRSGDRPPEQFPGQRQLIRLRVREQTQRARERTSEQQAATDEWRRAFRARFDLPDRTPEEALAELKFVPVDQA